MIVNKNEYGVPVSVHVCKTCGDIFTVCPAKSKWDNCMAKECASYDPLCDADRYFEAGLVKEKE